jgi:hypothetical protein
MNPTLLIAGEMEVLFSQEKENRVNEEFFL